MVPGLSRSTVYFLVLFVGACVMFVGGATWFAMADMDYHFSYSDQQEDAPRFEKVGYYEELSSEQKEMFHGAVEDGKSYSLEEKDQLPASVIRYEGTYYVFDTGGHYDWLDPKTGGSAFIGLLGLGMMVEAARRDMRYT